MIICVLEETEAGNGVEHQGGQGVKILNKVVIPKVASSQRHKEGEGVGLQDIQGESD